MKSKKKFFTKVVISIAIVALILTTFLPFLPYFLAQ